MGADKKYLKRLSDYVVIQGTDYLIEPYVPIGALVFICGLPKTFKSFLGGIDWGYSVATPGCQWLGRMTRNGRVAYYALEGYKGALRRAEAWRIFHKKPKADGDNLVYITDRISFAAKTCSADQHFTILQKAGFRPDLVIIDTWFKATAGGDVGGQPDMTTALKNIREFQSRLTEWKVQDGLPEVTLVVIAHTDKHGRALFGSVAQFADADVLYQLERVEHANQATLTCIDARDIEEPPAITFEMQKVEIVTAMGKEFNLVVSKEVPEQEQTRQTKQDAKKAAKDVILDDVAVRTLLGFGPQNWTGWSEWLEVTKLKRPSKKLGNDTFNEVVKRLIRQERVRKNLEGLYQVVLGAADDDAQNCPNTPSPDAPTPTPGTPDSYSYKRVGVSGVGVTPRSTPGVPGVTPTRNGNAKGSVVEDKAAIALEHLLNKRPA